MILKIAAKEKPEIVLFASASKRGGRKGGLGGNSARRAGRAQNQFGFFQIHTAKPENSIFIEYSGLMKGMRTQEGVGKPEVSRKRKAVREIYFPDVGKPWVSEKFGIPVSPPEKLWNFLRVQKTIYEVEEREKDLTGSFLVPNRPNFENQRKGFELEN